MKTQNKTAISRMVRLGSLAVIFALGYKLLEHCSSTTQDSVITALLVIGFPVAVCGEILQWRSRQPSADTDQSH
jgi:hypothetical protein